MCPIVLFRTIDDVAYRQQRCLRMVSRSYLFVPGDRSEMLAKAGSRGADAVIADLEDAVSATNKDQAREMVTAWLGAAGASDTGERWVRFNSGDSFMADVEALAGTSFDGAVLSKVLTPEEVAESVQILSEAGLCSAVIPLIETARGLLTCAAIAEVSGVHRLMIGEADLGAELGLVAGDPAWDGIRMQIVVASAAARIHPPIGPVDPEFADLATLARDTLRLRSLGFSGRAAIHPAQIAVIHEGLAPSTEEIAHATDVLTASAAAQGDAVGAFVGPDGTMVDDAYVRWARRIIGDAERGKGNRS
jgi:citrate lyase subunit beta/citryl-CoA lyase